MGFEALGLGFDEWDPVKVAYNGNEKDVLFVLQITLVNSLNA